MHFIVTYNDINHKNSHCIPHIKIVIKWKKWCHDFDFEYLYPDIEDIDNRIKLHASNKRKDYITYIVYTIVYLYLW